VPEPEAPGTQVPTPAASGRPDKVPSAIMPAWRAALGAVVVGAGVGVLGTVLHTNFTWLGEAVLPWGSVLALVLAASAQLWWTLRSSVAWAGGGTAIAAFTTALALSAWPGLDTFAVALNEYTLRVVPGPAISGAVWLWGIPVVAVLMMILAQPLLRVPASRD
jgi:hypothetical protein